VSLVVAVDLPWGESGADRFAWAVVDAEKGLVVDLQWGMTEVQFLGYLDSLEQGCVGLVALDIPINGHEWMTREGQHFRPLDRALQSAGVPLYPSLRQGDRGARLASEVRRALRDPACPVYEVYPYANLCVLRAQAGEKGTPRAPWGVPLRYKNGPKEGRRRACHASGAFCTRSCASPTVTCRRAPQATRLGRWIVWPTPTTLAWPPCPDYIGFAAATAPAWSEMMSMGGCSC
jgi:hypothetical protein